MILEIDFKIEEVVSCLQEGPLLSNMHITKLW